MKGLDMASSLTSRVAYMPYMASTANLYNSTYLCTPPPPKVAISSIRSSLKPHQTFLSCSYKGISSVSACPLHWRYDSFSCARPNEDVTYDVLSLYSSSHSSLPRKRRFSPSPRAFNYPYPALTEKPRWWWRTLACLPYLIPLHLTWYFAGESYHLRPLVEKSDFLSNPYNNFLRTLPSWLLMAYTLTVCFAIVKRKKWPHFLRFHVMMAILLENWMHIIIIVYGWVPPFVRWGNNIGTHVWAAITFVYLLTVLDCIRCTLSGKYADVPFVSDAANFHLNHG